MPKDGWLGIYSQPLWVVVTRYSGVTVWVFHPFPYSPLTVAKGTLSLAPQHVVVSNQPIVVDEYLLKGCKQKVKHK